MMIESSTLSSHSHHHLISEGGDSLACTNSRSTIRPKSLLDGVKLGLYGALADPLHGYAVDGVKGFFVGTAKGSLGLIGRPLFGLLGSSTSTLGRIYLSLGFIPKFLGQETLRRLRARPPRFFSSGTHPLKVYRANENVGLELLSRIEQSEFRFETYLWHTTLPMEKAIVVTKGRVIFVNDVRGRATVSWQCPLSSIYSIAVDDDVERGGAAEGSPLAYTMRSSKRRAVEEEGEVEMEKDEGGDDHLAMQKARARPVLHVYHSPSPSGVEMRNR